MLHQFRHATIHNLRFSGLQIKKKQLVYCDFDGMIVPEMTKKRPVIIVSFRYRHGLCTIVPVSTVPPSKIEDWHYKLPKKSLPTSLRNQECWVKCDMITSVATGRLERVKNGGQFANFFVSEEDFAEIIKGIKVFFEF